MIDEKIKLLLLLKFRKYVMNYYRVLKKLFRNF